MVERLLSMQEVPRSILGISKWAASLVIFSFALFPHANFGKVNTCCCICRCEREKVVVVVLCFSGEFGLWDSHWWDMARAQVGERQIEWERFRCSRIVKSIPLIMGSSKADHAETLPLTSSGYLSSFRTSNVL